MIKKHMKVKKTIALLTAVTCSLSFTGCSSVISADVSKYPLTSMASNQEIVDYYAKSMEYDSVVSRNVQVHETKYEVKDIEGSKEKVLKSLVKQAEEILSQDEYIADEESSKIVSQDTYDYIKATLDNESLSKSTIENITGALGYYFVDVRYQVSSSKAGEFKPQASLLGLDGVWKTNYDGQPILDSAYLTQIANNLSKYFKDNLIGKKAVIKDGVIELEDAEIEKPTDTTDTLDTRETPDAVDTGDTGDNDTDNGTTPVAMNRSNNNFITTATKKANMIPLSTASMGTDNSEDGIEPTSETDSSENGTDTDENKTDNKEKAEEEGKRKARLSELTESVELVEQTPANYTDTVDDNRKIKLNIPFINSVAGAGLSQKAFLPSLGDVYEIPKGNGLGGYGIYTAGADGLRLFKFNRDKLAGEVTLRFVFKDSDDASGTIVGTNIYMTSEDITTGVSVAEQEVLIPDYLQSKLEQTIERSDRAQANIDLSGMLSNNLYEDIGVAILAGYKNNSTRTLKYMSTLRQVLVRDTKDNAYLVEVETTMTDGARSVDCYGTYRDKYYAVIQQKGNNFVITDMIRISREMVTEPPIYPNSSTENRLIALNLSGEISEKDQEEIKELLSNLYTAGSNRILRAQDEDGNYQTITVDGQEQEIKFGMYDCFNSDTTMLSTDELEYMQSYLRNKLTKYGTDISSIYQGTVTSFIGGYSNQAELTAEELITYNGRDTGCYMKVYYLVSKMGDYWVIDERKVLSEEELQGEQLNNVLERIQ